MINGNISGIKQYTLDLMEQIYEIQVPRGEFCTQELLNALAEFSSDLSREISVFLGRGGKVLDVSIGSSTDVTMPYMRKRRGTQGLSGVRCIHTHPSGTSHLSEVDIGTLLSSRMDAMAALSVKEGRAISMCVGYVGEELHTPLLYGPFNATKIPTSALFAEIERSTVRVNALIELHSTEEEEERAMLIGLNVENLDELEALAETAGVICVSKDIQKRQRDHGCYIGSGKARELALKASALDADVAIFDDELTVTETSNLEQLLGLKVIDRPTLILDIFAAHAKSREGRLQVELAQLKYNLPRLIGEGIALSRLGGGIGTRGPGEKKIEVDRRVIRRRIFELEQETEKLAGQRKLRRREREKNRTREVALVGYTNAGKSSILKTLTGDDVYVENKLFATLDPLTRRVEMPSGSQVLFTDTVGFIEKLPHDLINAFRSTLEEALNAEILLHVIDVSSPDHERHEEVVKDVLHGLGAGNKRTIKVYNKCDLVDEYPPSSENCVFISAKKGIGTEEMLVIINEALKPKTVEIKLKLGYHEGSKLAKIQRHCLDVEVSYEEEFMSVTANAPQDVLHHLRDTI